MNDLYIKIIGMLLCLASSESSLDSGITCSFSDIQGNALHVFMIKEEKMPEIVEEKHD